MVGKKSITVDCDLRLKKKILWIYQKFLTHWILRKKYLKNAHIFLHTTKILTYLKVEMISSVIFFVSLIATEFAHRVYYFTTEIRIHLN